MSTLPKVLITGATSGLGWHATQQIAETGRYHVFLGCRSLSKGESAKAEIAKGNTSLASRITALEIDIQSDKSIDNAVSSITSTHGVLDILINNAGTNKARDANASLREQFHEIFDTNVASHGIVTEKFIPLLRASKYPNKRIVFTSSRLGSFSDATNPEHRYYATYFHIYRSSKSAVNMLATYFSNILKSDGIAVSVVCPGYCKTKFTGFLGDKSSEEGGATIVQVALDGSNEERTGRWFDDDGLVAW